MKFGILLLSLFLVVGNGMARAEEAKPADKKAKMEFTKEEREQMAANHEKMATCLRSDKSFKECRKEMREACHEKMGEGGCPMMGKMRGKRGMHRGMQMEK